jgi:hypothetical protein
MIKRSGIETIDFDDEFNDDEKVYYCKSCLEYGYKVRLKNRLYPEGEAIPVDHEQFKQCHDCGLIVPVYELQKESEIKDVVETTDNPFDESKNQFLGIDNRHSSSGKKSRSKRQRDQELDDIKELELKAELRKGHTLLSY